MATSPLENMATLVAALADGATISIPSATQRTGASEDSCRRYLHTLEMGVTQIQSNGKYRKTWRWVNAEKKPTTLGSLIDQINTLAKQDRQVLVRLIMALEEKE